MSVIEEEGDVLGSGAGGGGTKAPVNCTRAITGEQEYMRIELWQ